VNIDTFSIARDLRAVELPAEQAEAIAAAIGRSVQESSATKADLELVRSTLDAKIEQVRADLEMKIEQVRSDLEMKIEQLRTGMELKIEQLRTDIERTRNQLLIGFVSTQVALAGVIIAVIKL
jgi:hypothetical protein